VLAKRQKTPEYLELAFQDECSLLGVSALDKDQFVSLVERLIVDHRNALKAGSNGGGGGSMSGSKSGGGGSGGSNKISMAASSSALGSSSSPAKSLTAREYDELEADFDEADADNSGGVDLCVL